MRAIFKGLMHFVCLMVSMCFFSIVLAAHLPDTKKTETTATEADDVETALPKDAKIVLGNEENDFFIVTPSSPKKLRLAAEEAERQKLADEAAKAISLHPKEVVGRVSYVDPKRNVERLAQVANSQAKKANQISGPLAVFADPFSNIKIENVVVKHSKPTLLANTYQGKAKKTVATKTDANRQFDERIGKKSVVEQSMKVKKKISDPGETQVSHTLKQKPQEKKMHRSVRKDGVTKKLAKKTRWHRDIKHTLILPGRKIPSMSEIVSFAKQHQDQKHTLHLPPQAKVQPGVASKVREKVKVTSLKLPAVSSSINKKKLASHGQTKKALKGTPSKKVAHIKKQMSKQVASHQPVKKVSAIRKLDKKKVVMTTSDTPRVKQQVAGKHSVKLKPVTRLKPVARLKHPHDQKRGLDGVKVKVSKHPVLSQHKKMASHHPKGVLTKPAVKQ